MQPTATARGRARRRRDDDPFWRRDDGALRAAGHARARCSTSPPRSSPSSPSGPSCTWPSTSPTGSSCALSIPAAGFLLRTFILFHDCTHGSLFHSRRANTWGGRIFGLLVVPVLRQLAPPSRLPPRLRRRPRPPRHRRRHHLDRRRVLLEAAPLAGRLPPLPPPARHVRHRPDLVAADRPADLGRRQAGEAAQQHPADQPRASSSMVGGAMLLLRLAGGAADRGADDPDRRHRRASGSSSSSTSSRTSTGRAATAGTTPRPPCRGSSYLKLPQPFQFFTGNIGLHHVHHLSARVPNYNLQRAHDEVEVFHAGAGADVPRQPPLLAAEALGRALEAASSPSPRARRACGPHRRRPAPPPPPPSSRPERFESAPP